MKCEQILEWIGSYCDYSETDIRKHSVDKHILLCPECMSDFQAWKESNTLIRDSFELENDLTIELDSEMELPKMKQNFSSQVMERIYATDTWRRPVAQRGMNLSFKAFRQLAIASSFFLALFIVSFTYSIMFPPITEAPVEQLVGLSPVAASSGDNIVDLSNTVAMASITLPMKLTPTPEQGELNYLLVLSLVGILSVIMLMNWFSRIRA